MWRVARELKEGDYWAVDIPGSSGRNIDSFGLGIWSIELTDGMMGWQLFYM